MWSLLGSLISSFLLPRRNVLLAIAAALAVFLSHLPSPAGAKAQAPKPQQTIRPGR